MKENIKLLFQALIKYVLGLVMIVLLLFWPAGTFDFWNAWIFIALLFLSFPLVLGSFISFIIFLIFPFTLVKRIKNEEKVLEEGLKGYKEYKQKVKYKMIPFVW